MQSLLLSLMGPVKTASSDSLHVSRTCLCASRDRFCANLGSLSWCGPIFAVLDAKFKAASRRASNDWRLGADGLHDLVIWPLSPYGY